MRCCKKKLSLLPIASLAIILACSFRNILPNAIQSEWLDYSLVENLYDALDNNNSTRISRSMSAPLVDDEDDAFPFTFSACLIEKDDIRILPEWIAYHYEVMPLRRLIVAVDPYSKTSPKDYIQPFIDELGMDITIWHDEDYITGDPIYKGQETPPEERYKLHLWRQRVFYTACLNTLKKENKTWTLLIDTDEYLTLNKYSPDEGEPWRCQTNANHSERAVCNDKFQREMATGQHPRARYATHSTVAHYIANETQRHPLYWHWTKPCICLPRLLFGVSESSHEEIYDKVPEGFDAQKFYTLRYRHHQVKQNSMPGKSIMDASQFNGALVSSAHRVSKHQCVNGPVVPISEAMFRVHHYIGPKEVYASRKSDQAFVSRATFKTRGANDDVRKWLSSFANHVGKQRALALTEGLRDKAYQEFANLTKMTTTIAPSSADPEIPVETTTAPVVQQAEPKDSDDFPFAFSACLIEKDDNRILPEWIAYHYEVMPLRHLIIAVDPYSKTSPEKYVEPFRELGMDIEVWRDEDYVAGDPIYKGEATPPEERYGLHLWRQRVFYTACLRRFKQQNRTWTMLIDTDEYLTFNHYNPDEGEPWRCQTNRDAAARAECNDKFNTEMANGEHPRARLPDLGTSSTTTVAHYIANETKRSPLYWHWNQPCVCLPRLLFSNQESTDNETYNQIPEGFDPHAFYTLKYRHHQIKQNSMPGKSIMDASRFNGALVSSAHRASIQQCVNGPVVPISEAMFRVHHYVGPEAVYASRKNDFESRSSVAIAGANDDLRGWLASFANRVGKDQALSLTEALRAKAFDEMKNLQVNQTK